MSPPESSSVSIAPDNPVGAAARQLIGALCAEMSARYGQPPSPFSTAEASMPRTVFLVAWQDGQAIGCGALRPLEGDSAEIKRMYVVPSARRQGLARRILLELEQRAREYGYRMLRLETGVLQPEAQRLYEALGFKRIPAFGPYIGNPTSICFEKVLPAEVPSPEAVVQRQLEAYNAHDLDALMAVYALDARLYEYPDQLLAEGATAIRAHFAARFAEPNLHARLLRRLAVGGAVIDHEEVTRTFPEGPGTLELVAIYEICRGQIAAARFITGRKTLVAR